MGKITRSDSRIVNYDRYAAAAKRSAEEMMDRVPQFYGGNSVAHKEGYAYTPAMTANLIVLSQLEEDELVGDPNCEECGGKGKVACQTCGGAGVNCPDCGGSGMEDCNCVSQEDYEPSVFEHQEWQDLPFGGDEMGMEYGGGGFDLESQPKRKLVKLSQYAHPESPSAKSREDQQWQLAMEYVNTPDPALQQEIKKRLVADLYRELAPDGATKQAIIQLATAFINSAKSLKQQETAPITASIKPSIKEAIDAIAALAPTARLSPDGKFNRLASASITGLVAELPLADDKKSWLITRAKSGIVDDTTYVRDLKIALRGK